MTKPHYFSRTAHVQDNRCPRSRYWATIYDGIGLEPTGINQDLIFGSVIHDGIYTLWMTGDVDTACDALRAVKNWDLLIDHWQYMAECHVRAYARVVYPRLKEQWKLVAAEEELALKVGVSPLGRDLFLLVKPDLIIEHIDYGIKKYQEFKSTKLLTPGFIENWRHNVQLSGGVAAYREKGIDIDYVQVPFFYKGEQGDSYWRSVFTSAWRRPRKVKPSEIGVGEMPTLPGPLDAYEIVPKRPQSWKGWERFDVHVSGISPKDWVLQLDETILGEQMPSTPDLAFDPLMTADWLEQLQFREGDIADYWQHYAVLVNEVESSQPGPISLAEGERSLKNRVFPQSFDQCVPAVGHRCPFYDLCWNEQTAKNPISSGLYAQRKPHHNIEIAALGLNSAD